MILWQVTDLSVKDSEGKYVDEVLAGQDVRLGFDLAKLPDGTVQMDVEILSATAQLYRYLRPEERQFGSPYQVAVGDEIEREEDSGNEATFTIPGESLTVGEQYQLVIRAEDATTRQFGVTREIRVVAGP